MPRQRTTLRRLFRYARPYRVRLSWAIVGMVVYAIGSAGLAYLLKGLGSYASSYLMADVGQRVVMDLRNALYRHILDQSASFFAHGATGRLLSRINNDVGQVQQAVSDTVGDLAREIPDGVGHGLLHLPDVVVDAREQPPGGAVREEPGGLPENVAIQGVAHVHH